jgi:MerR family transcriptional regulator, mercuric resistance operon regulatory protein
MRAPVDETTPWLPIGVLAQRSGLTVEGIRFYERAGILRAAARTAGRHRLYSRSELKRLTFIRRARELGFCLDDVRTLLGLADDRGERRCADAHRLAVKHLEDVRARIASLERMEIALLGVAAKCADGTQLECPLIDSLSGSEPA